MPQFLRGIRDLWTHEAIMKDGGDTLLANLQKLGQVRVDHNMRTIKPVCTPLSNQCYPPKFDEDRYRQQTRRNASTSRACFRKIRRVLLDNHTTA